MFDNGKCELKNMKVARFTLLNKAPTDGGMKRSESIQSITSSIKDFSISEKQLGKAGSFTNDHSRSRVFSNKGDSFLNNSGDFFAGSAVYRAAGAAIGDLFNSDGPQVSAPVPLGKRLPSSSSIMSIERKAENHSGSSRHGIDGFAPAVNFDPSSLFLQGSMDERHSESAFDAAFNTFPDALNLPVTNSIPLTSEVNDASTDLETGTPTLASPSLLTQQLDQLASLQNEQ